MLRRWSTGRLAASVWPRLRALIVTMSVMAAGCGGGSPRAGAPAGGCSPSVQERLDSRSTKHLFPGAAEPSYLTDPPTSGPHQLGPPPTGAVASPISRPRQVGMLESGFVIIQYRGLSTAEQTTLAALAGSLVTVAPAAGSLPGRVVATAWTWKQVCGAVNSSNVIALRAFIMAHKGNGFSHG